MFATTQLWVGTVFPDIRNSKSRIQEELGRYGLELRDPDTIDPEGGGGLYHRDVKRKSDKSGNTGPYRIDPVAGDDHKAFAAGIRLASSDIHSPYVAADDSLVGKLGEVREDVPDAHVLAFPTQTRHTTELWVGTVMPSVNPTVDGLRSQLRDRGLSLVDPLSAFRGSLRSYGVRAASNGGNGSGLYSVGLLGDPDCRKAIIGVQIGKSGGLRDSEQPACVTADETVVEELDRVRTDIHDARIVAFSYQLTP